MLQLEGATVVFAYSVAQERTELLEVLLLLAHVLRVWQAHTALLRERYPLPHADSAHLGHLERLPVLHLQHSVCRARLARILRILEPTPAISVMLGRTAPRLVLRHTQLVYRARQEHGALR